MSREFTKVGVIGLGTMGVGIVEVFARNGIDVVAMEVDDAAVERGKGVLAKSTGRALDRGKITQEDHDALHARVTYTTDMGDFADCQLVVEAVPEQLHLKKELFATGLVHSDDTPVDLLEDHRDKPRGKRCAQ